jgi:hypothetical protein
VRLLGPPVALEDCEYVDTLGPLERRLAEAGGDALGLEAVRLALENLFHIAETYSKGLFANHRPSEYRGLVEQYYTSVEEKVRDARRELGAWASAPEPLGGAAGGAEADATVVTPGALVRMLGGAATLAAARAAIAAGRLGPAVDAGKEKGVRLADLLAALRARALEPAAAEAPPRKATSAPKAPPRGRGKRGAAKKARKAPKRGKRRA